MKVQLKVKWAHALSDFYILKIPLFIQGIIWPRTIEVIHKKLIRIGLCEKHKPKIIR